MFTRGCRHVYHIFTCGVQYLKKSYYLGQVVQRSEPRKLNKPKNQKPKQQSAGTGQRMKSPGTRNMSGLSQKSTEIEIDRKKNFLVQSKDDDRKKRKTLTIKWIISQQVAPEPENRASGVCCRRAPDTGPGQDKLPSRTKRSESHSESEYCC